MSRIQEFDFTVNLLKVIPWQYNKAVNLTQQLTLKTAWYAENHTDFWNDWLVDIFDLRTANDFGLSVWSIILDLPLFTAEDPSPPDYPAFGFAPYQGNFFNYNFALDAEAIINLTTEEKREVLRMRYFSLTTNMTVPNINAFLDYLYGPDYCYVLDNQDMTIEYVYINGHPQDVINAMLQTGVFPKPYGVSVTVQNGP